MLEIGNVVKLYRKLRGMTLEETAVKAEISTSYLSQIEHDSVNMNLSVLEKLSIALNVPVQKFFIQDSLNNIFISRNGERTISKRANGALEETLFDKNDNSKTILLTLPKGYEDLKLASHSGDESLLVLSGAMEIDFGGYKTEVINTGDFIEYSSMIPHRFISKEGCKVFVNSVTTSVAYI